LSWHQNVHNLTIVVHDNLKKVTIGVESTPDHTARAVGFARRPRFVLKCGYDVGLGHASLSHPHARVGQDLGHSHLREATGNDEGKLADGVAVNRYSHGMQPVATYL
jgi:hypothetical protein